MKVTGRHNARDWSLKRAKNGDNKHTKNIFLAFPLTLKLNHTQFKSEKWSNTRIWNI